MSLYPERSFLRHCNQVLSVSALLVMLSAAAFAQTAPEPVPSPTEEVLSSVPPATASEADKAAEALQTRIGRARALIAAHRLDTAASELESVRASAKDNSIRNITSIMLMSVYLEEGNYGRAEALLEETFRARAAQKDESLGAYFALSGQAVNGARTHLARYRTFGISTTADNLPAEVQTDLNRLRALLERMIAQAKEVSSTRRAYDSWSLLEDVLGLRLSLATNSEDRAKWESEYASAREALASSQTQIASLGGVPPLRPGKNAVNNSSSPSPYSTKRPPENAGDSAPREKSDAHAERNLHPLPDAFVEGAQPTQDAEKKPAEESTGDAGSLSAFATKKVVPRYPPIAKQNGTTGMVRVHVIVEGGKVIAVSRTEGPMLLRQAAEDAVRQWTFQVISLEGRPARLNGYVDFNFSL